MEPDPRFTVVLAAVEDAERERLLRLLGGRFCIRALRSEPFGTFSAVHAKRPDVVLSDAECAQEVLACVEDGDPPPSTWLVILDDALDGALPQGLTRLPSTASDRRILAATSAAGRFARTGVHTRVRPVPVARPQHDDGAAALLERLARQADSA